MRKIFLVTLILFSLQVIIAQELPLELFKGVERCYVKTHRILPEYDLQRTYITTKKFYEFDDEGRIKEIQSYGGNNSYQGYYTFSYSDTLDVRSFYSTHNVITERYTTEHLNDLGDTEETLYSWGGKLLRRIISSTNAAKTQTKYEYYNDAGYPLYSDVKHKFPDGRIEKIISYDYDGFPVYYDYFVYDENKRIDSQRKVDYLDSLITVVEYDYDENDNLIKKASINFKTNRSIVENFAYDILNRLTLETIYEKSEDFGGIEELIMKREIYYEGYEYIHDDFYRGDDAKRNLQAKLQEKAERDAKRLAKLKEKQDREREKSEKKERERLEKENQLLEERDVYKLEKSQVDESEKDKEEEEATSQE
jgi:hypothetical protein